MLSQWQQYKEQLDEILKQLPFKRREKIETSKAWYRFIDDSDMEAGEEILTQARHSLASWRFEKSRG